jgi:hypothetical protein
MRTKHVELQVSVIGDSHELGVAWSPQDGVVGAREVRYLEGERFCVEVCTTPECYEQVDLPEGNGLEPRYDFMEQSTRWPYRFSRQPYGVAGLDVEEVEVAPAIHEDLRQVGLAADRVDDKGKTSWLQNVVGAIFLSKMIAVSDHFQEG